MKQLMWFGQTSRQATQKTPLALSFLNHLKVHLYPCLYSQRYPPAENTVSVIQLDIARCVSFFKFKKEQGYFSKCSIIPGLKQTT